MEPSIESRVIQKHRGMIVDRITKSVGPLWLSQKLQQEDFMSTERASDILNTPGIPSSDKVSQMLEAVESQIKCAVVKDRGRFFGKFVAIVESESALEDVCKALDDCYQALCRSTYDLEAHPPLPDEDDDTDLDTNIERQRLLPRRQERDGAGESVQRFKTEGVHVFRKEKGRPGIQCCVCSITTMSVMAVMACAFLASNRDDSDINIGRPRRSIGYPQHGKALSVHSIFEFLLQISPTIVMFAFAITTYCTGADRLLKWKPKFLNYFIHLMAACFYGVAILLHLVPWLQFGLSFCINSSCFISAAVFVYPDNIKKTRWIVTAILMGLLIAIIVIYVLYMINWNDAPPALSEAIIGGIFSLVVLIGNLYMHRALSLSRITTLTEAKRYVLAIIILLVYMGYFFYCVYMYEGFTRDAAINICTIIMGCFSMSTMLKGGWDL